MNGYPRSFINRFKTQKKTEHTDQEEAKKGFATLPYIRGVTERIARILQRNQITASTRPVNTLREKLSRPKDKLQTEQRTEVVYQIPCNN